MGAGRRQGSHRIDLVQRLPLLVGHMQGLGRLDRPLHVAGPHLELPDVLALDEAGQGAGKLGGQRGGDPHPSIGEP